ncbi:MAG: lactonase family protein [Mycobacteriales bacterium]
MTATDGSAPSDMSRRIYVGAYTVAERPGAVATYDLDAASGALRLVDSVDARSASFVAVHPSGRVVYAVSEGEKGTVAAYSVGADGRLSRVGPPRETGGAEPCHLSVAPDGRWLIVANYASGSIAVLPLDSDGWLPGDRVDLVEHHGSGPDPSRQSGPHAHNVRFSPAGHLFAVDLGTDTIFTYRLDGASGEIESIATRRTPPGAGPRHIAFDRSGHAFVACELDSTVLAYGVDAASGVLEHLATAPAVHGAFETDGPERNYPSEIAVGGDGRFLYVANRGTDVLTVFTIDNGSPQSVADVPTGGANPRGFVLVDDLLLIANQNSNSIAVFRVDTATGIPAPLGTPVERSGAACVVPA